MPLTHKLVTELERDIRSTDCRWIVTDTDHAPLLDGIETGVPAERLLVVDEPGYAATLAGFAGAP